MSCKTPTNLTVDGFSAQAEAFECLNGTHTLLMFSLVMLFTAKRNLSPGSTYKVWIWIVGPFQDSNPKAW